MSAHSILARLRPGGGHLGRRAGVVSLVLAVLTVLLGTSAWAYWTSVGFGSGSAQTGTLNAPSSVTATSEPGSGEVTVEWGAPLGGSAPTGYYVTRSDGPTAVCGSPTSLVTTLSCTDSSVPGGTYTYTVTAVLGSWTASASSNSVVVTTESGSTTTLTSSANPSEVGDAVTYTATVTDGPGETPTGSVDFSDNGTPIGCTNPDQSLNAAGVATCTVTYTELGSHPITAHYTGDEGFSPSSDTLTQVVGDTGAPYVTGVTSTLADGSYTTGQVVPVTVTFSEPVTVTGTPQLALATGSPVSSAVDYLSGSGTATLTFSYTVAAANVSSDLDYVASSSLTLNGGSIVDAATNAANLTLPAPGAAGSLGANKNIVIDNAAATVTTVSSPLADGSYKAGQVVPVTVTFNEPVTVTGTPQLTLSTGSPASTTVSYASGSGSNTLTFNYTVAAANFSADLTYPNTTSLANVGGSTVKDAAGNVATLTLPAPGGPGSLSLNKNIVIDNTGPTVTNVSSTLADGRYRVGQLVPVTVTFNEPVTVTGTPQLTLSTGSPASTAVDFTSGSGSNTLTFNYTVAASNSSADLNYPATTSLTLNGGTIKDAATNDATLALPAPAASGSLGTNKDIVIDNTVPTVTGVTLGGGSGFAGPGDTVQVLFSEPMDGSRFCPTWGSSGNQVLNTNNDVTVTITNAGTSDVLTVASGTCTLTAGSVALGGDYVNTGSATFRGTGNSGNRSEVSLSAGGLLTIKLGGLASGSINSAQAVTGTPVYTPPSGLTDLAGNALGTAPVNGASSRF